jgi:hypothetical protein
MWNENPLDYQHLYCPESHRPPPGERAKTRAAILGVQQVRYGDPIPACSGQDSSPEDDFSLIEIPSSNSQSHTHTTQTMINFIKYFLHNIFLIRPCWSKKQLIELCIAYFEWLHSSPSSSSTSSASSSSTVAVAVTAAVPQDKKPFQDLIHTLTTHLKNLLPCVAFLYTSGPWRNLYLRYKYDPSHPTPQPDDCQVPGVFQTITLKIRPQEYNKILRK